MQSWQWLISKPMQHFYWPYSWWQVCYPYANTMLATCDSYSWSMRNHVTISPMSNKQKDFKSTGLEQSNKLYLPFSNNKCRIRSYSFSFSSGAAKVMLVMSAAMTCVCQALGDLLLVSSAQSCLVTGSVTISKVGVPTKKTGCMHWWMHGFSCTRSKFGRSRLHLSTPVGRLMKLLLRWSSVDETSLTWSTWECAVHIA